MQNIVQLYTSCHHSDQSLVLAILPTPPSPCWCCRCLHHGQINSIWPTLCPPGTFFACKYKYTYELVKKILNLPNYFMSFVILKKGRSKHCLGNPPNTFTLLPLLTHRLKPSIGKESFLQTQFFSKSLFRKT